MHYIPTYCIKHSCSITHFTKILPILIFLEHSHRHSTGSESQNLSILSPFDEKEEWHKISEIINSFGANIGTDVKESTTPNNCKQLPNTTFLKYFFIRKCFLKTKMIQVDT